MQYSICVPSSGAFDHMLPTWLARCETPLPLGFDTLNAPEKKHETTKVYKRATFSDVRATKNERKQNDSLDAWPQPRPWGAGAAAR